MRRRQFRWSWPKFGRKSHQDPVQAQPHDPARPSPEEPVLPTQFLWSWPKFGRKQGVKELIFPIDGIDCSGHVRPELACLHTCGADLAAAHSAADYAALLAQLKEEVVAEQERRARHEARWPEILDLPQLFIAV